MLSRIASKYLSQTQKRKLKSLKHQLRVKYVQAFHAYDFDQLLKALAGLGLGPGDSVMLHSAYSPYSGFLGAPDQIIAALRQTIGPEGNLLMPSSSYNGSTEAFVKSGETFDVQKSASNMGILSELFRHQRGTQRSQNPAHPILAAGPRAAWFTEGHDRCLHSCADGSPFEKLLEADGKVLFFNVQLRYMMFFHYLEHMLQDQLPFELYDAQTYRVPIVDAAGAKRTVGVSVFSEQARKRRRFPRFVERLRQEGMVTECRLGNSKLALVRLGDTVQLAKTMAAEGSYFHEMNGSG